MDKKVYHSVRSEHTRPCLIQNSFQAFIYIKQSSVITFKNCQGKISHLYTREFATLYAKTLWLKYRIFKERVFKKYEYLSFFISFYIWYFNPFWTEGTGQRWFQSILSCLNSVQTILMIIFSCRFLNIEKNWVHVCQLLSFKPNVFGFRANLGVTTIIFQILYISCVRIFFSWFPFLLNNFWAVLSYPKILRRRIQIGRHWHFDLLWRHVWQATIPNVIKQGSLTHPRF